MSRTQKFWCHVCWREVSTSDEGFKCPYCHRGFIEYYPNDSSSLTMADLPPVPTPAERNYTSRLASPGGWDLPEHDGPSTSRGLSRRPDVPNSTRFRPFSFNVFPQLRTEQIEAIPTVPVAQKQADQKAHCVVCLDVYEEDEPVRKLHCGHIFHEECILPWLKLSANCPICRDSTGLRAPVNFGIGDGLRNIGRVEGDRDDNGLLVQNAAAGSVQVEQNPTDDDNNDHGNDSDDPTGSHSESSS